MPPTHSPAPQPIVIPADVLTAYLAGEAVLLHMGTKRYYRLNDTAARVWRVLAETTDRAAVVRDLCAEYDVDEETAERSLDELLATLAERSLIALGEPSA